MRTLFTCPDHLQMGIKPVLLNLVVEAGKKTRSPLLMKSEIKQCLSKNFCSCQLSSDD
jgi:hypothetical protein